MAASLRERGARDSVIRAYCAVLRRGGRCRGRAGRREFWSFALVSVCISVVLAGLDGMLFSYGRYSGVGLLGGAYVLSVAVPALAVTVRRLHDMERSGWWVLLVLLPFTGPLSLLLWLSLPGGSGDNRFGSRLPSSC